MKKPVKITFVAIALVVSFVAWITVTYPSRDTVIQKAELLLNYKFRDPVSVIEKSGILWGGFQGDYSVNGVIRIGPNDFVFLKRLIQEQMSVAKPPLSSDANLPEHREFKLCSVRSEPLCVELWHPFEKVDETFNWFLKDSDRTLTYRFSSW